jgi:hypothetical protein
MELTACHMVDGVKERTLLVKSKTRSKAVLHATFESQKDQGHASGEAHSHGVGDNRRDLTNRVIRSDTDGEVSFAGTIDFKKKIF